MSEELKKECEELRATKQKLEQQLEEAASSERGGVSEQVVSELKEQCDRLTQVCLHVVCLFDVCLFV